MAVNDLVVSFDCGSIKTGYAVLDYGCRLHLAGILTGDRKSDPSEIRIHKICEHVLALLQEWRPRTVLIEWLSGKLNRRRHRAQGQGLQIHGAATSAVWREAVHWRQLLPAEDRIRVEIHLIRENTWTRGVHKEDRQIAVAQEFPEYSMADDKGADISDAIGLVRWWLQERKVRCGS